MAAIPPKKRLYEQFAQVARAMGSANRLELLEILGQGERSVDELAKASGMSVANTSHHLQILRDGGLVHSRKEGVQVFYQLADATIPALLGGIRRVAENQLAEVERIVRENFESRDSLTPVKRTELMKLVKGGDAVVIDVRPASEYAAGHIPGALSIPLDSLPQRLKALPKKQEVVAYCRGPYCMLAFDAVDQLRKSGYRARRLEEGYPEWKAEKRPVEGK
ncbi:MAG TPA: metalloregulator ArsR/SmtB family transcription factor [Thiobacillus sp.]|nr:metalloregulator ArsR/SmtB family transcription factor [Thiobacillus sp.]